ncbi:MAG: aldo/keto reductase [Bacillota bacterium]|nr:aldo/keto reductase [Bacillota bacterium]
MKYRKFGKLGFETSALGFGCMRLPVVNDGTNQIDEPEAIKMIRHAIDNGVNYIDTAYPYHHGASELLVAKALKDGYRERVKLATKLPTWLINDYSDFNKYINVQLEKLNTEYIDLYLLHALDKDRWDKLLKLDVFKAIEEYKSSGKIKYMGFSFHDDIDTFKRIIDSYDWDFCQIQFNYMDENYQAGLEGLKYAAAKGIAVVIMEPIRGGKLAQKPADQIQKLWDSAEIKRTPVEWALGWVWNHPEVSVVLSGMSTFEQIKDNLRIADEFESGSLNDKEIELIGKVRETYKSLSKVSCTGCEYCMPCPFGVNIPGSFKIYNEFFMYGNLEEKKRSYKSNEGNADKCRECGKCEKVCPQKLSIREYLKDVARLMS